MNIKFIRSVVDASGVKIVRASVPDTHPKAKPGQRKFKGYGFVRVQEGNVLERSSLTWPSEDMAYEQAHKFFHLRSM